MIATFNSNNFLSENRDGFTPNSLFNFLKKVNTSVGYWGAYLFVPIGQLAGFLLIKKLESQQSKLEKVISQIINSTSDMTLSDLRSLHLEIESTNKEYSKLLEGFLKIEDKPTFYRSMFNRMGEIFDKDKLLFEEFEMKIRLAAYPSIQRELSTQQKEILKQSYSNQNILDWDDDSMDIYEHEFSLSK